MNANQVKALENTNWSHVLIAQYATGKYQQGEIISRHKSYQTAERGVRRAKCHASFVAIQALADYR